MKFYQQLNDWRKSYGGNRRSRKTAHSDPAQGAGDGTGGPAAEPGITIPSINSVAARALQAGVRAGGIVQYDPTSDTHYVNGVPVPHWQLVMPAAAPMMTATEMSAKQKEEAAKRMQAAWDQLMLNALSRFVPPPAQPIPYAGVRSGEIIGHRIWYVVEERGELWLCSVAHKRLWKPGETIEGNINEKVDEGILGGTYSYKDGHEAHHHAAVAAGQMRHLKQMRVDVDVSGLNFNNVHGVAIGTIKMWGEVVEHERGYRAQYAKVDSLLEAGDEEGLLDRWDGDPALRERRERLNHLMSKLCAKYFGRD